MKISELLKEKATISFEVFPPKNKEGDISSIYYTIEELAKLDPDFYQCYIRSRRIFQGKDRGDRIGH